MRTVLPGLSAIAAHPVKVIGTFFVLAIASAIVIPDELGWLSLTRMVTVVAGVTVIGVTAGAAGLRNRLPRRPKVPKRRIAKLERIGSQPPAQLHVPQSRCQICRRPLTNPRSQMDGVGPDCRGKYGTRPQFIPNPARAEWERRRFQALARQEREQALHDQQHHVALIEHDRLVRHWEVDCQTPANQARAGVVRVSTKTLIIDLGLVVSYVLSELVALGVNAAGLSLW